MILKIKNKVKNRAQSISEYALLVAMITAAFIGMQVFVRRSVDSNVAVLEGKYKPSAEEEVDIPCNPDPCGPKPCDKNACEDPCNPNARNPELCGCKPDGCAVDACEGLICDCSTNPCLILAKYAEGSHQPCFYECDDCKNDCKDLYLTSSAEAICEDCVYDTCTQKMANYCWDYAQGECNYNSNQQICSDHCGLPGGVTDPEAHLRRPRYFFANASLNRYSFGAGSFGTGSFILATIPGDPSDPVQCYQDCMNGLYNQCLTPSYESCAGNCSQWDFENNEPISGTCTNTTSSGYSVWEECMLAERCYDSRIGYETSMSSCIGNYETYWLDEPCSWENRDYTNDYIECAETNCGADMCP